MARRAHGEGSYDFVERLGVWRWRGYYTNAMGEKKRKEIVAKNRKQLREKVKAFLEEIALGDGVTERIGVSEWCDIWLDRIVRPSTKARTAANYEMTVRNHILPPWGDKKLDMITTLDIQDYLNVLAVDHKTSTVCTIKTHIVACFNAANNFGYLRTNVAKQTRVPKSRGRARSSALSEEEIYKLLKIAEQGEYIYHGCEKNKWQENDGMVFLRRCYEAVVFLALSTGMRQGEILALKWPTINFKRSLLCVAYSLSDTRKNGLRIESTKTGSQRNILLAKKSIKVLLEWKKYQEDYAKKYVGLYDNQEDLVFTNSYGKPISATNFLHRYFRKMLRAAGISDEVRFHDLRHTHATQLLRAGVNVKVVAERLGHASVSTTMNVYAHALKDMQLAAVEELNKIF